MGFLARLFGRKPALAIDPNRSKPAAGSERQAVPPTPGKRPPAFAAPTGGSSLGTPAKPWNRKNVKAWGKSLADRGECKGAIYRRAMDLIGQTRNPDEMQALMALANTIEDALVDRNLKGIEYEKAGEDGKAIRLYEANVKDGFDGSHPYEQLRIIYTERGRMKEVRRVCAAYLKHGHDAALKGKYETILASLTEENVG